MTKEQNKLIEKLFRENGARMVQWAYRIIGDRELAEDIMQESLLIACCKIEELFSHPNQMGWLYKTVWNLSMRERQKAYHTEVPLDLNFAEQSEPDLSMEYYLPKELGSADREIILMRIDQGLSYAEIAEIRGISEPACRQQLSRAIRKCRALIDKAENASFV